MVETENMTNEWRHSHRSPGTRFSCYHVRSHEAENPYRAGRVLNRSGSSLFYKSENKILLIFQPGCKSGLTKNNSSAFAYTPVCPQNCCVLDSVL